MSKPLFILNLGAARSGTTSLHSFFQNHPFVSTPKKTKEIKFFIDNSSCSAQEYIACFHGIDFSGKRPIYFESSPPYVHRSLQEFCICLERMINTLKPVGDVLIIFCLRNLAKRAFSHYWHDISKHYSIYGGRWGVADKSSDLRYQTLFESGFGAVVSGAQRHRVKYLPDLLGCINESISAVGANSVRILLTEELDDSIRELCNDLEIEFRSTWLSRTAGVKAPFYLKNQSLRLDNVDLYIDSSLSFSLNDIDVRINVEPKSLLRVGFDGIEVIDGNLYDAESIFHSQFKWTRELSKQECNELLGDHLRQQETKWNESCLSSLCRYSAEDSDWFKLFSPSTLSVRSQAIELLR